MATGVLNKQNVNTVRLILIVLMIYMRILGRDLNRAGDG